MKTRYIIALATGALVLAGCQRELLPEGDVNFGDGQIRYSISNVGVKSSADDVPGTGSLSLVSGDVKLTVPVTCEVSEGIDLGSGSAATKGALINTTGSDSALPADLGFTVSAYKGSSPQFENKTATKSGDYWTMDPPQYWPLSTNLTFYAYTNASGNTVAQTATSQTLTYTVTGDAAAHKDLMLGYYKGNGGNKGIAEMRFDHPLTAVRFKKGEMEDVTGIKSITISGLAKSGTVVMDADGVIGNWTVAGTEEYKTEVTLSPSGAATTLGVDEDTKLIGTDATGNYNGAFLLIPQTLSDHDVTVTAVLSTESGDDVTVKAYITSGTWQAGMTNTYTLGYEKSLGPLLPGKFSISATKYVQFSRGNLMATRSSSSSDDWKLGFFANQYDYGKATSFTANDTEMSLFTFGFDSKATSFDPIGQATGSDDWGNEYNRQYSLPSGTWQTLTGGPDGEWWYLLDGRPNAANLKVFKTVHGISNCLIIFPDDFDTSDIPAATSLTDAQWSDLENKGAVCLPQAGYRVASTYGTSSNGYWANNSYGAYNAYGAFFFGSTTVTSDGGGSRNCGYSVRLVQRSNKPVEYVEIAAKYDGVNVTTLKWTKQNLSITASGDKSWKGGNSTAVKVPGTDEDVINGDFFQWPAYAGYCGNAADADKGLLVYTSFTSKMCGDGSDAFAFKSDKKFQVANTPYYVSGYEKYAEVSHLTIDRTGAYTGHNDDVANIILGGNWRMPTCAEFNRMIEATYWAWDATDKGYYVFIPDASHAANTRVNL